MLKLRVIVVPFVAVLLLSGFGVRLQAAEKLTAEQVSALIPQLFRLHLKQHEMDAPFTRRLVKEFLTQLDPSRTLFLKAEADAIAKLEDKDVLTLVEQSMAGDLSFFRKVLQNFLDQQVAGNAPLFDSLDQRLDEVRALLKDKKKVAAQEPKPEPETVAPASLPAGTEAGVTGSDFDDENEKIVWRERPATQAEREKRLLRAIASFFRINKTYLSENEAFKLAVQTLREERNRWLKINVEEDTPRFFLKAFMSAMDPHTDYFDADDDDFTERLEPSFAGIGVQIKPCPLGAQIDEIIKGGPCDRSGRFMPRDQIVAVDDFSLAGLPINKIVRRIKGKIGTDVRLTIFRPHTKATEIIALKRDKIDLSEIRVKGKKFETPGGAVGLVSVQTFYKGVHEDVRTRLRELAREKPLAAVVLDLRSNHGGYLEEAVGLAGLFIESGSVVGERDGRDPPQIDWKDDPDPSAEYLGPLVVLVNQFSASASEIVAGTLKDYGRAVVVGASQTFGKGSVQRVIPLRTLNLPGEIKITTHQYFLAGGNSVQMNGVQPDVAIPGPKLMEEEGMLERASENAIPASKIRGKLDQADANVKLWLDWKARSVPLLSEKSKQRVEANAEFKRAFDPKTRAVSPTPEEPASRNPDEPPPVAEKKDEKDFQAEEAAAIAADMIANWPDVTKQVAK